MKTAPARQPAPPWDLQIKRNFQARVKVEIVDRATGKVDRESDWIENLAFDNALSYLVSGNTSFFANLFTTLKIGSGTNPNSYARRRSHVYAGRQPSHRQWFVLQLRHGRRDPQIRHRQRRGGAIHNGLHIANTRHRQQQRHSRSHSRDRVDGTRQSTALQTWVANSTGYQTNAGDNSTVVTGGAITLKRTFLFATPGSPQTINEIGYSDNSNADGTCRGRIVLGSSYVVDTLHFFRCVMQLNLTIAPASPTAVINVGTNINTAGAVMFEYYDFITVAANGSTAGYQSGAATNFMDGGLGGPRFGLRKTNWSQPGAINTGAWPSGDSTYTVLLNNFSTSGQPIGQAVSTTNFSWTTAGETLYGFGIGALATMNTCWTLQLTTPTTLPTGSFQGSLSVTKIFTRTLTN